MRILKTFSLAAIATAAAAPALADAAMHDAKWTLYDAGYEAALADHGMVVGTAVYGSGEADYGAHLTDAAVFPPLLGHYDADYEGTIDRAAFVDTELASR
ncbi:MAG: hypothetical protein AAF762_11120 [Pseudomonadota bacterium]